MAKYNDLRPTRPDDSLKRLVRRVNNPQTVAHGVKVAQPDERVVFYDSSYVARTWDGDAIADFDTRISEAKTAISQATDSLAATENNLAAARDRIARVEADTDPVAIGDTAAAQINDRQLIVGRDAVVPGTLDVAQLNVTEQMSAQMVSAMSLESKKLVVTGEAIMNQLTVVQDIVTPSLVAQRVNSALITGTVLQTSPLDNTGVKISNNGYKAYDSAGNLAVNLDGKNNLMIGSFQTSTQASSGVKISQGSTIAAIDLYTPNWGGNATTQNSHGGIWFDVPGTLANRGLNIFATDNPAVGSLDPGIKLSPAGGVIEFQGRFGTSGNAFKRGVVNGASIAKDGWWTMNVTFPEPMAYDPAVFISPVTENNVECAIGIKNATRYGFTAVVVNKSQRDSGYAWLKWVALAI